MIAVDTNILVAAIQTFDPLTRVTARRAVKALYRVATRPANANGLGFSPEEAARLVDRFPTILRLLPETPGIFPTCRELVLQHRVSGIHVHDARIAPA